MEFSVNHSYVAADFIPLTEQGRVVAGENLR